MTTDQWIAVLAISVPTMLFLIGVLLGIIGYFFSTRLTAIDNAQVVHGEKLETIGTEVTEVKTKAAKMETSVGYLTEQTDDLCTRVGQVENHISNTERIAVMEKTQATQEKEISELRTWRHTVSEKQHEILMRAEAALAGLAAKVQAT